GEDTKSLAAVVILSDGVVVNGSELVNGLNSMLPAGVSVSGGLAGDQARFSATWVLAGAEFGSSSVAAVGLYGNRVHTSYGSRGGWDRFGPSRIVTRSEGNKLFELDGKPALELYKSYLGAYADGLPGSALLFPLSVHSPDRATDAVRTILSVDESDQSMTFAGDIPMGSSTQLMRATHDMLIDGAGDAAEACIESSSPGTGSPNTGSPNSGPQGLALAVSCVGRRLVLGERAEEEVESVTGALGDMPLVGFYSNGELSPQDGFCDLLNQTMTLTIMAEH
ncbi:MAG: FIST signal transduction protein, partial [Acidimicrobiia bacterium]